MTFSSLCSQVFERAIPFGMRFQLELESPHIAVGRVITSEDLKWICLTEERLGNSGTAITDADRAMRLWRQSGVTPAKDMLIQWLLQRAVVQLESPSFGRILFASELSGDSVGAAGTAPSLTTPRGGHVAVVRNIRPSSAGAGGLDASPGASAGGAPSGSGAAAVRASRDGGSGARVADDMLQGRLRAWTPPRDSGGGAGAGGAAQGDVNFDVTGTSLHTDKASEWETLRRDSTYIGRVGLWEERRMNRSGDVYFFNPVTRLGAFHIDEVEHPTAAALSRRVLGDGDAGASRGACRRHSLTPACCVVSLARCRDVAVAWVVVLHQRCRVCCYCRLWLCTCAEVVCRQACW